MSIFDIEGVDFFGELADASSDVQSFLKDIRSDKDRLREYIVAHKRILKVEDELRQEGIQIPKTERKLHGLSGFNIVNKLIYGKDIGEAEGLPFLLPAYALYGDLIGRGFQSLEIARKDIGLLSKRARRLKEFSESEVGKTAFHCTASIRRTKGELALSLSWVLTLHVEKLVKWRYFKRKKAIELNANGSGTFRKNPPRTRGKVSGRNKNVDSKKAASNRRWLSEGHWLTDGQGKIQLLDQKDIVGSQRLRRNFRELERSGSDETGAIKPKMYDGVLTLSTFKKD
jgi:hypothetical protein